MIDPPQDPNPPDAHDPYPPDAATLHRYTGRPSDVVTLTGYLGAGDTNDTRRLYTDIDQRQWITVDVADIVHRCSECDALTSGRSVVRIKRDAHIVVAEGMPVADYAPTARPDSLSSGAPVFLRPKWPPPPWPPPHRPYLLKYTVVTAEGDGGL
ncbi:MAG: hypothetical protein QOD83_3065 [Solirubrobacteraceae bacterium]|jgi:hypothetical protein|nr:hypothetical protein [Solirubrobacteraceae bacterium]